MAQERGAGFFQFSSSQAATPKEVKKSQIFILYDEEQQIVAWKKDGILQPTTKDELLDALIMNPDLLERLPDVARSKLLRSSLSDSERLELDKLTLNFLKKSRENLNQHQHILEYSSGYPS